MLGAPHLACSELHTERCSPQQPHSLFINAPAGKGAEWRRALASISNTKAQQQAQQPHAAAPKPAAKQGTKRRAAAEPTAGNGGGEGAAAAAAGTGSRPTSAAAGTASKRHQATGGQADGTSRRVAAPKPHHPHTTVARRSGPSCPATCLQSWK